MAHFAQLNDENIVETVIVVSNDDCGGGDFPESEPIGKAFIQSIGLSGRWVQTSYNGSFRKNYAGMGYFYDEVSDAFIPPKPHDSWVLDTESFIWVSPIPKPTS
jgi:hypothetical protein